jgi:phage terminase large subunit-like protein
VLDEMQGIQIRDISRTKASGSKTERFLEMQPYFASKRVTFTRDRHHVELCKEHMKKITANNTHKHDDLADNAYDAIKIALIDKSLYKLQNGPSASSDVMSKLGTQMRRQQFARTRRDGVR